MMFHDKKILITGGLGFIGSALARKLVHQGADVTLVDSMIPEFGGNYFNIHDIRDQVKVNISDVRDVSSMEPLILGKDFLFNLAAQTSHVDSMLHPFIDHEINSRAQLSILECCRKVNPDIKIIYASTRQLYGRPDYLPVNEEHPTRPVDINGINKLSGEWYHILYNNIYGIRSSVLRLTNTYGPGMRVKDARQTFIGIWIKLLLEGRTLQVFGDGLQLRDFNYVDDCVDAFLQVACSDKANGRIFNIGSSEVMTLKSLAQMMIEVNGAGSYNCVGFPSERKLIDIGDYYSDFTQIRNVLGWEPRIPMVVGIKKTLDFYKSYAEHYWER